MIAIRMRRICGNTGRASPQALKRILSASHAAGFIFTLHGEVFFFCEVYAAFFFKKKQVVVNIATRLPNER